MESYRILRCLTAPGHSADSEKAELLGQVDRAWIFIRGTRVGDSSSYVLFISTYLKPYEYDINTYAYDMYTWARKAAKGQHMLTSFNGSRPAQNMTFTHTCSETSLRILMWNASYVQKHFSKT